MSEVATRVRRFAYADPPYPGQAKSRYGDVRITLDQINQLRALNGWKPLDMTGRWRRGR